MSGTDILIAVLMGATLFVLVAGVVFMMVGGKSNERLSNKLMVTRVVLQASVIGVIGCLFLLSR